MKTLLIVFTYKYPYEPPIEQFLHMEMPYLKEKNVDILVVPCSGRLSTVNRYDVSEVKDSILKRNKIVDILLGAKGILKKEFRKESKIIRTTVQKEHRKTAKKYALIHWIQANMFYSRFKKQLKNVVFEYNKIILYSYWLNPIAIAVALYGDYLREKGKNLIAVSRAHGQGDMYVDSQMTEYRPFARILNTKLNRIYSISKCGIEHLKSHGIDNGYLARLGVKKPEQSQEKIEKEKKLVVSCSVINDNKRVGEIARSIASLKTENVKWVHFGGGPKEDELREWCKSNMPNHVEWELKGWTAHSEVMHYYADNRPNAFINLSGIEGIPVSIMEAMSYSIPCVATRVGATPEIVKDGYNGYLVAEDFSTDEVAFAIDDVLGSDSAEMKKNAFNTWQTQYDSERNFREFAENLMKF